MDKIVLAMAAILAVIAATFITLTIIPGMQRDILIQQQGEYLEQQQRIVSISGDCTNSECIGNSIKDCNPSKTTMTFASNRQKTVTVTGEGISRSENICSIMIYDGTEPNPNDRFVSFVLYECKMSLSDMSNWNATSFDEVESKVLSSGNCGLSMP